MIAREHSLVSNDENTQAVTRLRLVVVKKAKLVSQHQ
jgi:hypothetical protein